jgi:hypothetical protein
MGTASVRDRNEVGSGLRPLVRTSPPATKQAQLRIRAQRHGSA